jgi:hypothetical protein
MMDKSVLAYVVVDCKVWDGPDVKNVIKAKPLVAGQEVEIEPDEKLVTVIPAMPGNRTK